MTPSSPIETQTQSGPQKPRTKPAAIPEASSTRIATSEAGRAYFDRSSRAVIRTVSRSPRSLSAMKMETPWARTKVKPPRMWAKRSQGCQSIGPSPVCLCGGRLANEGPRPQPDGHRQPEDEHGVHGVEGGDERGAIPQGGQARLDERQHQQRRGPQQQPRADSPDRPRRPDENWKI